MQQPTEVISSISMLASVVCDLGLQDLQDAFLGQRAKALHLSSLVKCPDRHTLACDLVCRPLNPPWTNSD